MKTLELQPEYRQFVDHYGLILPQQDDFAALAALAFLNVDEILREDIAAARQEPAPHDADNLYYYRKILESLNRTDLEALRKRLALASCGYYADYVSNMDGTLTA